ncbi:MAG TPA: insulinase family protein [Actinomycetota bacterium]|nr:insulinase family protein [Actinomycetota bacterium]
MSRFDVGTTIGGYRVDRVEWLEHLKGTYYELTHQPTGARHIHIEAPDDGKAFVVLFPTVPKDSTGVAHILEHVVLAGSERFDVRDPFFSMTRRSLSDFMNAMTGADATMYPFSTRNEKDFYNLLDVYLDATFFPRIEEKSFKQEGHRLEFEQTDDPSSGLRIKGVVFNEMKGAMASSAAVVYRSIGKALMPGSTYANNSGGDPEAIPDLTWENLKAFHARHYHPSNAWFYTYGDMPLEQVLERIEQLALSKFDRTEVDVAIPDQPRFDAPREYRDVYPLSRDEDPSKKAEVLVTWLTAKVSNSFEILALNILGEVLLKNAASPLRKALIESGLGEALASGSGFHDSFKEAVFAAGLKGADAADAQRIEELMLSTLRDLAEKGVDREMVDAAVHQGELSTREVSNAGFPYALRVFFYLSSAYVYGGDPYRALQLEQDFARLHDELKAGPFFENLIRKYLLDNPHRARMVVTPDQDMEDRQVAAERERVAAIEAKLTEDDKRAILDETMALKAEQEARQDISVLPTLELGDVPMRDEDVELSIERIHGAEVAFAPQPTNGLTYITILADFSGLDDRLKDRLPLFARALSRVGAGGHDYLSQALRIDRYTGGISAGVQLRHAANGEVLQQFSVGGKALARNHEPFVEVLRDVLTQLSFEPKRLKDIIAEYKAQSEAFVVQAGHMYAQLLAGSKLDAAGLLQERLSGLSQLALLKELAQLGPDDLAEVIADMTSIASQLFQAGGLHICVTTDDRHVDEVRALLQQALSTLPSGAPATATLAEFTPSGRFEAKTTSVPVTYNAKVVRTVGFTHPDAAPLMVLGNFLKATYLHREIREKGGAYGSMSNANREAGSFTFGSYRDPHVVRTFQTFDSAVDEVLGTQPDPDEFKEAILQSCSQVDPLSSPDIKGRRRYFDDLAGYTSEVRAEFKRRLLEVTEDDLKRVAQTYLKQGTSALGSVGNADKIKEANEVLGGVFEISSI